MWMNAYESDFKSTGLLSGQVTCKTCSTVLAIEGDATALGQPTTIPATLTEIFGQPTFQQV